MNAWDFAVTVWRRPGVEARCVALQNDHGQCAPLLLWGLWTIVEARALDSDAMARAVDLARDWTEQVIAPLRAARTRPRGASGDVAKAILTAELAAERALIEGLADLAGPPLEAQPDALGRLAAICLAWGSPAPMSALIGALAEAL